MPERRNVLLALGWYHHQLHRGVAKYASTHGWHLMAGVAYDSAVPWGWRGDGIVTLFYRGDDLPRFVKASGVPAVNLGLADAGVGAPRVVPDNRAIARMAAEYLLSRGFRQFACVGWLGRSDFMGRERTEAFAEAVGESGCRCERLSWSREGGRQQDVWAARRDWMVRRLGDLPHPLAVLAMRDDLAAEVVEACVDAGLRVPEEIAVLGIDNDEMVCDCVSVPLSSVDSDMEGMAYRGAALLDALMAGESPPTEPVRVPPKGIVTRASTDVLAVQNVEVARALQYIWRHHDTPIGVADVLERVAMSRRGLQKAFRRHLGRTPGQEIRRVHLDRAKALLVETEMKVAAVAAAAGFGTTKNLFQTFRRQVGLSPRQFRMRHRLARARPSEG